jgi:hypothetical protein
VAGTVRAIKAEFLAQIKQFQLAQESSSAQTKEFIEQQAREMEQVRPAVVLFHSLFSRYY